ncbi:hypothetical protein BU16DRAFT_571606 [Lophium mytilinum]|uniref:Peroxin 11C n=1 Tax=Lophium mytilinum TaxID=390894 RepID=A0A6A6R0L5_9PEZI|nr:hypothetical protein BU16DRAFT_571606 [Lophium mytilinum]
MSDETKVGPGAPSPQDANSAAASKEVSVPSHFTALPKQADRLLLRLNKLLASPGGLSSSLGTLSYTLYLLAYLETKAPTASAFSTQLRALINSPSTSSKTSTILIAPPGTPTPIASLGAVISKARTTLRLFSLIPLYARLRTLLKGPKPDDDIFVHRIAVTQCIAYVLYQALENIGFLTDAGIFPASVVARFNNGSPATARVYRAAYRSWLVGVSCDFLRLGRQAVVERRRRAVRARMTEEGRPVVEFKEEEEKAVDAQWWTELMVSSAWFPMAVQFGTDTGFPGWNLGLMGLCGLVATTGRTASLWRATRE